MKKTFALATAGAIALVLTGCGSNASDTDASGMSSDQMKSESMDSDAMDSDAMDADADPAADLVGPGCAGYADQVPTGAGSVSGMASDPVAMAASNNPLLTTLTAAVSGDLNPDVDLVSTLNNDEFTVFAPVDDAFAKIPADTIDTLKTDSDLLSSILTYHVIPGQLSPSDIDGTQTTVNGADLTVTGSGDDLMVNDAKVICGGVHTANATVYLIDTVLMPPEK